MERQEPCPSAARLDDTPQLAKVTRGPPGAGCRVRLASQSRPPRKPPTGRSTTRCGSMGSSLGRAVSAALGFSLRVRFRKCRSVLKSGMLPTESSATSPRYPPVLQSGIPLATVGPSGWAARCLRAFPPRP